MAQYQPNWQDPRVQRRIRRAVGFASGVFSATKARAWSTRGIDKWFGQAQTDLSKYLREQLLTVTDDRWNKDTGQCKQYALNSAGVQHLASQLTHPATPQQAAVEAAYTEYHAELESGVFVYRDQSSRLWHPLQNFRRQAKCEVLESAGYQWHYDIACCALTLIYQHSQRIPEHIVNGRWQQGPMDLYLFALRDYLRDRTGCRQRLAQEADVDPDTVKRIINALLAGAKLSVNDSTEIYKLLKGDLARIRFLQQHQFLTELRADIKTCWDYIKPTMPRRSKADKHNRQRMLAISSKQKWGLYFDLERTVLNEIRVFLCETDNKHFLEHDGWSCREPVDLVALRERIQERTGFELEIETKS